MDALILSRSGVVMRAFISGAFCCLMLATTHDSAGQVLSSSPLSEDEYTQVLNQVFRSEKSQPAAFTISARYFRADKREAQIDIQKPFKGVPSETVSIVDQPGVWGIAVDYKAKTGKVDPDAIAKAVHVVRHTITLSEQDTFHLGKTLLDALSATDTSLRHDFTENVAKGEATIVLDGTTYELWYEQGVFRVHWSVDDYLPDSGKFRVATPLAEWMEDLWQSAAKRKADPNAATSLHR